MNHRAYEEIHRFYRLAQIDFKRKLRKESGSHDWPQSPKARITHPQKGG